MKIRLSVIVGWRGMGRGEGGRGEEEEMNAKGFW